MAVRSTKAKIGRYAVRKGEGVSPSVVFATLSKMIS